MARKLKVYRTPIGFHDAYVAAPSQKAALKAWGSDADLFARGFAELVTDAALTAAPLEHPGEVIRLRRGSDAENMAALPKAAKRSNVTRSDPVLDDDIPSPRSRRHATDRKVAAETEGEQAKPRRSAARPRPAPPAQPPRPARSRRPARARLDKAEAALAEAEARHRETIETLRREEQALAARRRELERRHEAEVKRLEDRIAKARDEYSESLRAWRG
jgi:hypothetical protein